MRKVYVVLAGIVLIGLGIWVSGCNLADIAGPSATTTTTRHATTTTTHAATTTSTSTSTSTSTTTTTQAPPYKISGTISSGEVAWDWGALQVLISIDKFDHFLNQGANVMVGTGETSVTYEVTNLDPGTTEVYLAATLWKGTAEVGQGVPPPGSALGQYKDGLFEFFGQGTAEVVILDHDLTGIDWQTNIAMPTLEGSISGTILHLDTLNLPTDNNVIKVAASTGLNLPFSIAYFTTEAVASAETTKNFYIHIGQQGNYYLWATLYKGATVPRAQPINGDFRGEFSDGLVPPNMTGNWMLVSNPVVSAETGNPAMIESTGNDMTDIDFDLKAIKMP